MNINFQRPKATEPQQEYIAALFIDIGINTLAERKDYFKRVTGRSITWSDELTIVEAIEVINQLKEQKENDKSRRPTREMED